MAKDLMKSKLDELKAAIVSSKRPNGDLKLLSLFVEIGFNDKGQSMNHSVQFTNMDFTHLLVFNHKMADAFPNLVKYMDTDDNIAKQLHLDLFVDVPVDVYLDEIASLSIQRVEMMR